MQFNRFLPRPGVRSDNHVTDGGRKEYPDHKWYYMFLRNRELKRYIEIFTGRRAVMINTRSGIKEERYFCFKVFSYTSADHKRRFERCPYSKEEYAARRESAFAVRRRLRQALYRSWTLWRMKGNHGWWLSVCMCPVGWIEFHPCPSVPPAVSCKRPQFL